MRGQESDPKQQGMQTQTWGGNQNDPKMTQPFGPLVAIL